MSGRSRWAPAALLVLLCVVAFGPALSGDFLWDDDTHLLDNPVFDDTGLVGVWLSPPQRINYWPVTFTSYWLEHALWGFAPFGYHLVNVLLHALASLLVWRVLARLGAPFPWLAALVFAVHPVNVESVAWIAQRKNVLSLLFFAASLLLYLRFEDGRGRREYGLALLAFAAAMLSKGAAAPLPAVLLLCAWWRRGTVTRRDVLRTLPFFAVTVAASLLELSTQVLVADGGATEVRSDDLVTRLVGAGWVWWFYLWKALMPLDLSFVYPRWQIDAGSPLAWLPLLAAAAVHAVAFRARAGWGRPVLFALLYFGLLLSPVLGFFDIYYMRFSYVADHYQYLALVGIVALVVSGGGTLLSRSGRLPRPALRALAAAVVGALTVGSALQSADYRSAEGLWRATLSRNPDAFLAHYNLARLLHENGRLDQAAHHYRERLRIEAGRQAPGHAMAANNLGRLAQDRGELAAARDWYRRAIEIDPGLLEPHNNLAVLLERQGEVDAAIAEYRRALAIAPDSAAVHYNLGLLFERQGRWREALAAYGRAAAADPGFARARAGSRRARAALAADGSGPGRTRGPLP